MTQPEILLRAAYLLSGPERSPFTREALAVKAWQLSPTQFNLGIYPYPNCNKVWACMAHRYGPIYHGFIVALGKGRYAITDKGIAQVEHPVSMRNVRVNVNGGTKDRQTTLSNGLAVFLRRVGKSTARRLDLRGERAAITFADAVDLFLGDSLQCREKFYELIGQVEASLDGTALPLLDGKAVEQGTVNGLRNLAAHLEERFERHFAVIANRQKRKGAVA